MKRKVVSYPDIMSGKPHLSGTHITVSSLISKVIKGQTVVQISRQFPQIDEDDVIIALKFAETVCSKPIIKDSEDKEES